MKTKELRAKHKAARDELRGILAKDTADIVEDDATRADALVEEIRKFSEEIEAYERREQALADADRRAAAADALEERQEPGEKRPGIRVTSEERTYTRHKDTNNRQSFFKDFYQAHELGDVQAKDRLERHSREAQVEGEVVQVRGMADAETRATTTASYAGLVVPQYLVELSTNVLRNGRPLANACTRLPLPDEGMVFYIPRATTGASAASQATENTVVSSTDQVWGNVTVPVATIAGKNEVSRQSLERGTPGLDQLVYADIVAAYAAEVDRQVWVGTGAPGQMTGINGQAGISTATAFGAALTVASFYSKGAGQIAAIAGAGTQVRPGYWVMHPRRWGWLTLQVDSAGRPLVVPLMNGPVNGIGVNSNPGAYGADGDPSSTSGFDIVGYYHGLPVITDANAPVNLGGGSTEDIQLVFDPRHALLFEDGDGMPRQLRFEQQKGDQLTVILAAYNYAAFTAGRLPAAFGRVGGADSTGANGCQNPAF